MTHYSYQCGDFAEAHSTSNLIPVDQARCVTTREGYVSQYQAGAEIGDRPADYRRSLGLNTGAADFTPPAKSSSAGETLVHGRTSFGSPVMGRELAMTDLVKVGGTETTVQVAEHMGLIARNDRGQWVEKPQEQEAPKQDAPVDDAQALSEPAAEGEVAALCQGTSGLTQVAVIEEMIDGGEVTDRTLSRAASEMGIEPEALQGRLGTVMAGFTAQAGAFVTGLGSEDPDSFFEWAQANEGKELGKAMRHHAMERSPKAYAPIYQRYVEGLAERDPDRVLNADFGPGVRVQRIDGNVVLNIPGAGQMTYRSAVKAGLIRVRGA